ncbi:7-cyano-7-deazaguanine synthase [Novosphingobium sp. KACC 22771]|uniref:7-cyano-7-deazaguanine synthase n=1 Tax=Novosphingobium sp. KACC 22771 TaxID=3025670 RepID=UPI002366B54B|nr:7-cyano-7-deazaguanine synthase [Novosphingobium sp. KACC 22771]WDF72304.1 7-cyano-7-deazaguanine synthase [Novosphingobium sp. KACC 22771]
MSKLTYKELPKLEVVVSEKRRRADGRTSCVIGEHIQFDENKLLSYCFAEWKPVVFDMLVVAAAVEFCDRLQRRPAIDWRRDINLEIPVHDKPLWDSPTVKDALHSALGFLTGDRWNVSFVPRKAPEVSRTQPSLPLPSGARAIVPFSDGMDSRAVAALSAQKLNSAVIRVRLGSKKHDQPKTDGRLQPFTNIPYKVNSSERRFIESSNRSRGFKFSVIAGIAAYLTDVDTIIIPESGQGALGPPLIPVVQAYPDYRNHPRFTERMEKFFAALLGHNVTYTFPRLWFTKGETLKAFVTETSEGDDWDKTISCWQQNRHVPVDGHKRQCGICAACMLRRLSVHAAGLSEPSDRYVWENLSASTFEGGAAQSFKKITPALREYAIAGTMHMDHLAGLADLPRYQSMIRRNAAQIAKALGLTNADAEMKLTSLLRRHRAEWQAFVGSLGPDSFIRQWAVNVS